MISLYSSFRGKRLTSTIAVEIDQDWVLLRTGVPLTKGAPQNNSVVGVPGVVSLREAPRQR